MREERLRASGEWDEAQRRHADYFLELAELSFSANWDQLEKIMARVEARLRKYSRRAHLGLGDRRNHTWSAHGGALRRFWDSHSHFLEGLDWLERFITRAGTPTEPRRAGRAG